ncbi:hypothetical protein HZH68_003026 [Vespula germanica]|uniref:Uncharacterized protein n=1 Tax=Vespula germanica TaxID=30212 RepID=A0A834U2C9_VESGE|nr:hypothetical protein HZH68_003026 [Vespula germanica]
MALPKGLIPKEKTGQGRKGNPGAVMEEWFSITLEEPSRRSLKNILLHQPSSSAVFPPTLSPPCILLPDIHRPSPYFSTTLARPRFYVILRLRSSSRKFTGRFFASGDSKGQMEKGQKGENGGSSRRIEKPNLRDLRSSTQEDHDDDDDDDDDDEEEEEEEKEEKKGPRDRRLQLREHIPA